MPPPELHKISFAYYCENHEFQENFFGMLFGIKFPEYLGITSLKTIFGQKYT